MAGELGGRQASRISRKEHASTSGASWVKRTTQGQRKCRGRSRMVRLLYAFVKMHKESLKKSPFFDSETCRKAELPIVKRLYCSLLFYHTNQALSRGFRKIFRRNFEIDKNRQNTAGGTLPRGTSRVLPDGPRPFRSAAARPARAVSIYKDEKIGKPADFPKKYMKYCLQIHKTMLYY